MIRLRVTYKGRTRPTRRGSSMKLLHIAVVLPCLALSSQAGSLVPSQVDARARWIGHVDVQAFHDSQIYGLMLEADEHKQIELGLSHLFTTEGIDLFRDVRGATAYGLGAGDKEGVVLIDTTAGAEPALARWYEKLAAKPVEIGGQLCMQWGDEGRPAYSCLRTAPDTGERLLVVSHSRDGIEQALDVLAGERPSLASQPSAALPVDVASGTIAFFAAEGIVDQLHGVEGAGPHSAVARLAQGVRMELGEVGGRVFVDLRLKTGQDEDAIKLQQIVQGLMALVSFVGDEPEVQSTLARWLGAVQVTRADSTLRLRFDYDLRTMIREARVLEEIEREKRLEVETDGTGVRIKVK